MTKRLAGTALALATAAAVTLPAAPAHASCLPPSPPTTISCVVETVEEVVCFNAYILIVCL